LIELGGPAQKAGLVDVAQDDRAALYGAFLTLAMMLKGEDREHTLALWRRTRKRAFERDATTPIDATRDQAANRPAT